MLETKVSDLRTPAEKERVESQHGGDIAHPYVTDVDTPETQNCINDDSADAVRRRTLGIQ